MEVYFAAPVQRLDVYSLIPIQDFRSPFLLPGNDQLWADGYIRKFTFGLFDVDTDVSNSRSIDCKVAVDICRYNKVDDYQVRVTIDGKSSDILFVPTMNSTQRVQVGFIFGEYTTLGQSLSSVVIHATDGVIDLDLSSINPAWTNSSSISTHIQTKNIKIGFYTDIQRADNYFGLGGNTSEFFRGPGQYNGSESLLNMTNGTAAEIHIPSNPMVVNPDSAVVGTQPAAALSSWVGSTEIATIVSIKVKPFIFSGTDDIYDVVTDTTISSITGIILAVLFPLSK
jgi:hypothetical protein